MRFYLLDIITGLDDAFFKAVTLGSSNGVSTLRGQTPKPARKKYSVISTKSALKQMRDFYKTLGVGKHHDWGAYARPLAILPYQAFIQVNAPRIANNLPMLSFPPIYIGNLVKNFDMIGNPPKNWVAGSAGLFLGNGHVTTQPASYVSDTNVCYQNIILVPNTDYEIGFEFHTWVNWAGSLKYGIGNDLVSFTPSNQGHFSERKTHVFTTPSFAGFINTQICFVVSGGVQLGYINNVTCTPI